MNKKNTVAVYDNFMYAFAKLPSAIQRKVTDFLIKFRMDPSLPGLNYEKISEGPGYLICSVRIDDCYRGIVLRQKETGTYLLLWVDKHDEAYRWARRRHISVSPADGALQVYVCPEQILQPVQPHLDVKPLFDDLSDGQLKELGVPDDLLEYTRSLICETDFRRAQEVISVDVYEKLAFLVEGIPLREVLDYSRKLKESALESSGSPEALTLFNKAQPNQTGNGSAELNFAQAVRMPASQRSFTIIEGEEDLRRMMAAPLEKWRVFLHPLQQAAVYRTYNGSVRILGSAGTGKTVVAMHRAKYLAAHVKDDRTKILFTTFTKNLAADILNCLQKICSVEEMHRIEVINLDALVSRIFKDAGFSVDIAYGDKVNKLWEGAIAQSCSDLPSVDINFYKDEWNRVVMAQEAVSLEKYVKASRNGCGTRLNRRERIKVWEVFDNYINLMNERKVRDINAAMNDCAELILAKTSQYYYQHIIVDEGQDFSCSAYRLLRALAGSEHADDIFIVGDSHQRIYANYPVLSKCGINVRGRRSSTLKVNYRTTEETRKCAFALLDGLSFDDLDDGDEGSKDKCRSLTHGDNPVIKSFKNENEELQFIVQEIKKLESEGESLADICLAVRTRDLVDRYYHSLTDAGIKCHLISQNQVDNRALNGIRVATMHRVKGLEFKYMFIASVNEDVVPPKFSLSGSSSEDIVAAEKCLLYVAMTRAQKSVYLTGFGAISTLLQKYVQ
ncbi:MAG: 3'-5' exonuclease [Candidatus Bruticola sp.]